VPKSKNRLPYQSKSKQYEKLAEDGLVEPMVKRFGAPPLVAEVRGWQLTLLGNMTYCMSCDDVDVEGTAS
jgi:hypothetical protein